MKWNPDEDGITHINIYSKAKTELGRLLTNFSDLAVEIPEHGWFASVEGYWYWLSTGKQHEGLRRLWGASAKSYGKKLDKVPMDESAFHDYIKRAILLKIEQHPHLRQLLKESTLPLAHYYVYGMGPNAVVRETSHNWQLEWLEQIRKGLQLGLEPHCVEADTKIVLEDGSIKHVSELVEGDKLKVVYDPTKTTIERRPDGGYLVWGPAQVKSIL